MTEAIALAHDCGHGPAGHASEEAFSPYLPGGYDHAVYGADVTLAELNLCRETLDGVRNHSWRRPTPATPEGEVVAWADRIAYVCHDFEDAVRAGIVQPPTSCRARSRPSSAPRGPQQLGAFMAAVLEAVERTGGVGMTEPAAIGARRRSGRSTSNGSTCARPRSARPTRSSACCAAWSTSSSTRRAPHVTGGADLVPGSPGRGCARGALRERDDRPIRPRARRRAPRLAPGGAAARRLNPGVRGSTTLERPRHILRSMGILDEDVARVREVTDIVALASEHIALKRVGRRFIGLCPFHSEKSPSFSINPEMGVYYCFGCQKSGDAITFVREIEHLDFVEAVERLAGRAGITLRYDDASFSVERKRKQRLHDAIAEAIDYYHSLLLESADAGTARRYLRSRGYDGDVARRFSLGYAPDGYDALSRHLQNKKFARQDIVDAGLAFVNRTQKLQDQFRGRLMFPIWDARGEAVGFGGRTLDGQGPKYKNSPENPIYQKSRLLYGLHWAKGEIVARGEVVICEGYTDVMAFALAGVPTAVATCGTALADEHFLTLKNLARKVTLAYDADAAGQAAAERCYQWEQRFEVQFQVADLPAGRDPADVGRDDPEALVDAVTRATPFLEFRIDRLLAIADLDSLEGRARAAQDAAVLVAEHPNDLVRDQYVMKLAGRLDIDPDRLRETVARTPHARPHREPTRPPVAPGADRPVDRRELDALRWAVLAPDEMSGRLDLALFADPVARSAFEALIQWPWHECLEQAPPDAAALLQRLAVEEPGTNAAPAKRS